MNAPHRRSATPTARGARRAVAPLVLLAALAPAACGGGTGAAGATVEAPDSAAGARTVNVEVMPVAAGAFTETIRLTGTVEAHRDVTLSAEETGTVQALLVGRGERVRQGQPILRIDDSVLRAQVEQARAREELARETWERNRQLFEEEKAISELRYVEARASWREARADLDAIAARLERTVIRAPFAGVLDERLVEVGQLVSSGTAIGRLVDLDPVTITAGVPERYASDVERGSRATVTFEVLDERAFEGRLTFVGSVVDPRSRTFEVEFTLPNPEGRVKPEMVADVVLLRREWSEALVVPQEALVRAEDGFVVYVIEGEGAAAVARARPVELGPAQRNRAVVTRGLEVGDRIVVLGQARLADGDRVVVVEEREPVGSAGEAEAGETTG